MATKNKVKMAAGRLGGLIGGKRRAKKLTAKRRREIAQLAGAVGGVVRMSKLSQKGRSELGRKAVVRTSMDAGPKTLHHHTGSQLEVANAHERLRVNQ